MKSYVINLDRSPDRLKFFQEQANTFGLSFERVSAIDGQHLSPQDVREIQSESPEFQPLDSGNIGLYLSHKKCWQSLVESGAPHVAVFEDDAVLSPSISNTLRAIDEQRPNFDIIKLETSLRKIVCLREAIELSSGDKLQRLLSWHGGTAGYVISLACADRILQEKRPVPGIIDQTLFHPFSTVSSQFNIQQLNPAACIQSQFLAEENAKVFSSTLGRPRTRAKFFRYGPWIDASRMVRRQVESLRRHILARRADNEQIVIPFGATQRSRRAA